MPLTHSNKPPAMPATPSRQPPILPRQGSSAASTGPPTSAQPPATSPQPSPKIPPTQSPHPAGSPQPSQPPMSGMSKSRPPSTPPIAAPTLPMSHGRLPRLAPMSPNPTPASAPTTSTPAAPPTAYLARLIFLPARCALSRLSARRRVVSNAHICVCALGTPYCTEMDTTSASRDFSCCSHAWPVSRSIRCLMNTLSSGILSALLPRSSTTCTCWLHSTPLASRPFSSTMGGNPPWILPEIITGEPTKRSGMGKG
mmetsp:Transcript_14636/g.35351  ORF Transcript_14636/g.35351 Transcript_14636/m.35351 type:complete len:255 (+) Transcript_14636:454-1218(+)